MFAQLESINLKNQSSVEEVKNFLQEFDLKWDDKIDYTVVLRENGEIKATCSKEKNVFKCFAVKKEMQGQGISNKLITELNNKLFDEGVYHSFIFTKPENKSIFEGTGYKSIMDTSKVVLLENGIGGIEKYMNNIKKKYALEDKKERAAIVMNCNPFTFGHRHIIEKAAEENEEVLIFIVQEDKSLFPFRKRLAMVEAGTEDLDNVKVIPGGEYIISSATFPNYFLRENDDKLKIFTELDGKLFRDYFCKELNIKKRYLGEEPFCEVTRTYNETLKEIFKGYEVDIQIVERKKSGARAISASEVREKLKEENWDAVKELVPKSTLEFLESIEGKEIVEKIKKSNSPH